MKLGRITGRVWASVKDAQLTSCKLLIMQPIDAHESPLGRPLVAVDTIGAGDGDMVFWVGGGEATRRGDGNQIPSDATIVGFVDRLDM